MAGAADATVFVGVTGRRFAHVVADDSEADNQVFPLVADAVTGKGVEAVAGVHPHVTFGVPLRVLFATHQCFEFGKVGEPFAGL